MLDGLSAIIVCCGIGCVAAGGTVDETGVVANKFTTWSAVSGLSPVIFTVSGAFVINALFIAFNVCWSTCFGASTLTVPASGIVAIVFNTLLNDVGAEPVIATVPPSVTGVETATGVARAVPPELVIKSSI